MKKRIQTAVLVLALALTILPCSVAAAQDSTSKTLKVLAIGNSYSVDAMTYLYEIAEAQGAQEIVLGNLYISGCSLQTHRKNALNDKAAYEYYKNDSGEWQTTSKTTLLTGLQDEEWDIISFQQASGASGSPDTYNSDLDDLIDYVNKNKTNPNAKLVWHMTWAYQNGYSGLSDLYDNDQETMYRSICAAVQSKILTRPAFSGVIPSGTAIQNARGTALGDKLNRDGTHMNTLGRVTVAYTWYCTLTGDRPQKLNFSDVPDGVSLKSGKILTKATTLTAEQSDAIHRSVMAALDEPFNTCPSQNITDVAPSQWYHEAVDYVLTNGIMGGYSAEKFGPDDNLSRAMVVQVLYNKEGKPAVTAENKFPDVPDSQWYCNAVRWGAEKGVVTGYGDGSFKPNDNVTIEQVAVILHNYSGKPAATGDLSSVGKYDDWATSGLQWAVANGVLKNVPFTNATETATRAQTAQMLMNYMNR